MLGARADELDGVADLHVTRRQPAAGRPPEPLQHVDGGPRLMGWNEDVHVVHGANTDIPIVEEREGHALQDHRRDAGLGELAQDGSRIPQPYLVAVPGVPIDPLESPHERIAYAGSLESSVEVGQEAK